MTRPFKVGDYVECVDGCCEPGCVGRVAYIPRQPAFGIIWVKFSRSLRNRHVLYTMAEVKDIPGSIQLFHGKGSYWSFHPSSLRHTTKRRMSP
jgi:hypothetical protein